MGGEKKQALTIELISDEAYLSITKTSRAPATRDLQGLATLEAFRNIGERKHTRYYLYLPSVSADS